ncbi:MAG: hypothetical protein AABZ41_03790 [Bacteroidota bacterium]
MGTYEGDVGDAVLRIKGTQTEAAGAMRIRPVEGIGDTEKITEVLRQLQERGFFCLK